MPMSTHDSLHQFATLRLKTYILARKERELLVACRPPRGLTPPPSTRRVKVWSTTRVCGVQGHRLGDVAKLGERLECEREQGRVRRDGNSSRWQGAGKRMELKDSPLDPATDAYSRGTMWIGAIVHPEDQKEADDDSGSDTCT